MYPVGDRKRYFLPVDSGIGRIDGVAAISLNGRIGGVEAGLDADTEFDVAVMLTAAPVPARSDSTD